MIRWIFFSTVAMGLFYGLYCLALRRDHWLRLSHVYLALTMGFSLVLPIVQLPQRVADGMAAMPAMRTIYGSEVSIAAVDQAHNGIDVPTTVWMVGLAITLGVLLYQLVAQASTLIALRRRHTILRASDGFDLPRGASLLLLPDGTAPYSFFNHIVVGTQGLGDDELRSILTHESFHVRHLHSLEVLIMRLMCCLAWFNPFAWLMMREVRAVHEYQADEAVLDHCSHRGYLRLLYQQTTGFGYGHITNNFHSINLKNRITMMKRKKSRFGAWKASAALPVAALLMMVGCKPTERQTETIQPALDTSETTVTVEETVDSMPVATSATPVKVSSRPATVTQSGSNGGPTADMSTVDTDPEFPGGTTALYKYVSDNIHYPEKAKADGVEGRVYVRFVIEADGSVTNVELLRKVSKECDEEALRVVQNMPRWQPATKDGKHVRTQYVMPIYFQLK